MRISVLVICLAPWGLPQPALADKAEPRLNDKYHVTPAEQAACSSDAIRLCSDAYPDEDALIVCMKANRSQLSAKCQTAFESGLRRRHL